MRKRSLPEDCHEMYARLGLAEMEFRNLAQVYWVQERMAEWFCEAAEERWPDFYSYTEPERLRMLWENALARWPHVDSLVQSVLDAERAVYRDMGALA